MTLGFFAEDLEDEIRPGATRSEIAFHVQIIKAGQESHVVGAQEIKNVTLMAQSSPTLAQRQKMLLAQKLAVAL
jgi:hypothetical protein